MSVGIDEVIQQPGQQARVMMDAVSELIHVALPGELVSYDPAKQTAVIQPTIRNWKQSANPPLLMDVPVFQPGGNFNPKPGDGCLFVFAVRCIDAWWQSGGVSNPISARKHDLSDGFAFVGFRL